MNVFSTLLLLVVLAATTNFCDPSRGRGQGRSPRASVMKTCSTLLLVVIAATTSFCGPCRGHKLTPFPPTVPVSPDDAGTPNSAPVPPEAEQLSCADTTHALLELQHRACADSTSPLLQSLCSLPLRSCVLCDRAPVHAGRGTDRVHGPDAQDLPKHVKAASFTTDVSGTTVHAALEAVAFIKAAPANAARERHFRENQLPMLEGSETNAGQVDASDDLPKLQGATARTSADFEDDLDRDSEPRSLHSALGADPAVRAEQDGNNVQDSAQDLGSRLNDSDAARLSIHVQAASMTASIADEMADAVHQADTSTDSAPAKQQVLPLRAHDSRVAERQAGELEGSEADCNQVAASSDDSKLQGGLPRALDVGDQDLDLSLIHI